MWTLIRTLSYVLQCSFSFGFRIRDGPVVAPWRHRDLPHFFPAHYSSPQISTELAEDVTTEYFTQFDYRRAEDTFVDLRKDNESLRVALDDALNAIILERSLLCPDGGEISHDEALTLLHDRTDCCQFAGRKTSREGKTSVVLRFTVDGRPAEVKLSVGESVESISPAPCSSAYAQPSEHLDSGKVVNIAVETQTVQHATKHLEAFLSEVCPNNISDAKVRAVHWAQVQVVEGMRVKCIIELVSGAMHRVEMGFDTNETLLDLVHPPCPEPDDCCSLLWKSTLESAILEEIEALAQERDEKQRGLRYAQKPKPSSVTAAASHYFQRVGGHIPELDAEVPKVSLVEFGEWSQRGSEETPSHFDVRLTTNSSNHKACFPKLDTAVLSQGSCGSCWAFASAGVIGDRHCLANPDSMRSPDGERYTLSVQQILSCWHTDGCDGGHALKVYEKMTDQAQKLTYTHQYPYSVRCFVDTEGVTEDWGMFSCYSFRDLSNDDPRKPCGCVEQSKRPTNQPQCKAELATTGLITIRKFKGLHSPGSQKYVGRREVWSASEVVSAIKYVIYKDGPVYASFDVYEDFQPFLRNNPESVYRHRGAESGNKTGSHAVVMVGWGEDESNEQIVPYWTLRNSWGPRWGDAGHYRHIRGIDDCGIETGINFPVVESMDVHHTLEFTSATIEVQEVLPGRFSSDKKKIIWEFYINCSSRCNPVTVSFPELVQTKAQIDNGKLATKRESGKCCCHPFKFDQCIWMPYSRLEERWLSFLRGSNRTCGTYDFESGRAGAVEARKSQNQYCRDNIAVGTSGGRIFPVERTPGGRGFKVSIDLEAHPDLRGRHRIVVKAASPPAEGGAKVEQAYQVIIAETKYHSSLKKLFELHNILHEFDREDERFQKWERFGFQWATRQHYVMRVSVECSNPCKGVARFQGLNIALHPRGSEMVNLLPVNSKDDRILIWKVKLEDYLAATHTVVVTAQATDADIDQVATRAFNVDIPKVSDSQGSLWLPLGIKGVTSYPRHYKRNFLFSSKTYSHQILVLECTKPCELDSFSAVDWPGLRSGSTPSYQQMDAGAHKVALDFVYDYRIMHNRRVSALARVRSLQSSHFRKMKVYFVFGAEGCTSKDLTDDATRT